MMDRSGIMNRLNEIFQDVFDDEELTVTDETSTNDIESWDSLHHVLLFSAVENAFGMKFAMKEVLEMENVGAIVDIIAGRATK